MSALSLVVDGMFAKWHFTCDKKFYINKSSTNIVEKYRPMYISISIIIKI